MALAALRKAVSREPVFDPEQHTPRLAAARRELAEVNEQFARANATLAQGRRDAEDVRARPVLHYKDADGKEQRRQEMAVAQKLITDSNALRTELHRRAVALTAEIEALSKQATTEIIEALRPQHIELQRQMFLDWIKPLASSLVAREKMRSMLDELERHGVSTSGFKNINFFARVQDEADLLKVDARELIKNGVIKPADLPAGLAQAWGLA